MSKQNEKPQVKEQFKIPYNYAKIGSSVIAVDFDALITTNSEYSQTDIEQALSSKNISTLIEMSNYFYLTSGEYRRLIHSMSTIQTFQYMYAPYSHIKSKKNKATSIEKTYEDVTNFLTNYSIEETDAYVTFSVLLNGTFYGYEHISDDSVVLQELPPQYCRSTFDINGLHAIEFDFRYFDKIRNAKERMLMFDRLPDEFLKLYNEYKAGKESETAIEKYWRLLDINYTRCHYLTADRIPIFSSSFSEIVNLQEYKEIDKTRSKLDIYKIIVQKLPLDKNTNEPALEPDEAKEIHKNAKNMLGADQLVDVLTTPAEVEAVDISNKGENTKDIISIATTNMFSSMGTSQLLFNSGNTSIGLTESIKNDESLIVPLLSSYEKHYNSRLKQIGKSTINFFMRYLNLTIYNKEDKIGQLKEQATLGGAKLPYFIASTGLRQHELVSVIDFEDSIGIMDKLRPLQTSFTMSDKSNGRPETDNPSEETTKQKDNNTAKDRANK